MVQVVNFNENIGLLNSWSLLINVIQHRSHCRTIPCNSYPVSYLIMSLLSSPALISPSISCFGISSFSLPYLLFLLSSIPFTRSYLSLEYCCDSMYVRIAEFEYTGYRWMQPSLIILEENQRRKWEKGTKQQQQRGERACEEKRREEKRREENGDRNRKLEKRTGTTIEEKGKESRRK